MKHTILHVIAAVIDQADLRLYLKDGSTYTIPQGDERLQPVVTKITPLLMAGQVVEITLEDPTTNNPYHEYQQKSGGVVRFFRMARDTFRRLIGSKEEPIVQVQAVSGVLGARTSTSQVELVDPSPANSMFVTPQEPVRAVPTQAAKMAHAVEQIITHAKPASEPGFSEIPKDSDDTIVAVVENDGVPAVVSGVEKLYNQFAHAAKLGSTTAVDAFLKRISAVIQYREHSIEDLLKFMEKADLPIAEDGSIVIYKALQRVGESNRYVDVHSKKVNQGIGSYVCMDPSLVDHDRRVECSNGLHVARRQYLRGFGGNVIVLAKVAPEDVIAVPTYDANKMRVCGYHILFELPEEAAKAVRANRPFTEGDENQKLLGAALAGKHVEKLEEVRITGHQGKGVIITPLVKAPQTPPSDVQDAPKAVAIPTEKPDKPELTAPKVNPKALAQTVAEAKTESRVEKARRLYMAFTKAKPKDAKAAAQAVYDHKKATKISFSALGLSEAEVAALDKILKG